MCVLTDVYLNFNFIYSIDFECSLPISFFFSFFHLVTDSSIHTKSKHLIPDFSDMERNNIYAGTPPKVKSIALIPKLQQRKPPIPIRTDSTRSVGSITTMTTTPTTTPSNSFRLTNRSTDISSPSPSPSYGLTTATIKFKHGIDDIDGNIIPLQSVKEDESLEINNNHNKKNSKVVKSMTNYFISILDNSFDNIHIYMSPISFSSILSLFQT